MHRISITTLAFLSLIILGSLAWAGCGQASVPAALASGEVIISAKEWQFEPSTVRLEAGKPIKLTLRNEGKIEHNAFIPGIGADGKDVQVGVKAGESSTVEFTPANSGTYEITCTLPAHKDAGMTGKVDVVASGATKGG